VNEESRGLSIRVVVDGRTARSSTNRVAAESIRAATARAIALARASEPDDRLLPLYEPLPILPVDRWDSATASLSPGDRGEAVRAAIAEVQAMQQTAAGIFSSAASGHALLNSRGVFARHDETGAVFSITATAADSSGWAKASSVRAADLNAIALARRAATKAAQSASPVTMAPGEYTVVLEPAAVLDLVGQIFADVSATALEEERSFLTGRVNERLFGENITIHDDVRHPLQDGEPFDGEGVPRQTLTLFDRGTPTQIPYSRGSAHRAGKEATGHGYPLPNEVGEGPSNIVIAGGSFTLDELIRTMSRGILVTRLWYIRETDPYRKAMTGMTRDGTFLIDNGEIARGIHNFRFNVSVVDLLNRVEAMTAPVRASGEEAPDMVVPAMLVRDFPFTEVTLF
jgi:predicted Zn-dependent protease